jgi:carbonic anhydrase/acetyltransferase-like protein (isoleucine patch superfamily)
MPLYAIANRSPLVAPTAWVAPSADVIGEAVLGEHVSVWFGAVIRADNTAITIGARTNIQEGAMLHSDPGAPLAVGEGCTIGHHAILHGCTIADNVLVGMGATILNRAVIGADCLIGAGALVTEGKTFAPGQLILGSPAQAVRPLKEAEIAALRVSAAGYVAKAREYVTGLVRVDRA